MIADIDQKLIDAIIHGIMEQIRRELQGYKSFDFATVSTVVSATSARVRFAGDLTNESDPILVAASVGTLVVGSRVIVFFRKGDSNSKVIGVKIS